MKASHSFDGDRFCEIARLVDIGTHEERRVIGKKGVVTLFEMWSREADTALFGSVAKFCLVREFARVVATSCGSEDFELLGERRVRIEGVPRLSFAHHVDHLDAGQGDRGGVRRFETEHRPHPALDAPMILLDAVIEVLALADADRLRPAPGAILQSTCGIAGNDGFPVGLTAVDDDAIGTAMACQRFCEETLGGRQIPVFTEPELDAVADAVDGAIEVHPSPAHLDVGLVRMPFAGHGALAPVEAFHQQRREMNDPAMDR